MGTTCARGRGAADCAPEARGWYCSSVAAANSIDAPLKRIRVGRTDDRMVLATSDDVEAQRTVLHRGHAGCALWQPGNGR